MNSFFSYVKKEWMELIRSYRLLILAVGLIVFAVFDAIMLKLTPMILETQASGIDFSTLIEINHRAALRNYMGSLFEISSLIIALSLMGIISNELKEKTLVIPYTSGSNIEGIVCAKVFVYVSIMISFSVIGMLFNHYYGCILFGIQITNIFVIIKSGLLYGLFFSFLVTLTIFLSSFFKKPLVAGLLSLLIIYILPTMSNLLNIKKYSPAFLLEEAKYLSLLPSSDMNMSILWTVALIILLTLGTIQRLKSLEIG